MKLYERDGEWRGRIEEALSKATGPRDRHELTRQEVRERVRSLPKPHLQRHKGKLSLLFLTVNFLTLR